MSSSPHDAFHSPTSPLSHLFHRRLAPSRAGRRLEGAAAPARGSSALLRALARAAAPAGLAAPARLQASFSFGLDTLTWSTQFVFGASGETTQAKIVLDLLAFIRNAVAASKTTDPEFIELSQIDVSKISSTRDLLTAAIVGQSFSLIMLVLCAWKIPVWLLARFPQFASGAAVFAAFFQFVSVVNFAAAGLEKAFCDSLDPDPTVTLLPCGQGYGYAAGSAAIFFSWVWAAACWHWVPWSDVADGGSAADGASESGPKAGYEGVSSSGGGGGGGGGSSSGGDASSGGALSPIALANGYQSV